jgi:glutamine synthetase
MFKETPESVREKGFRNLTTMTPGFFRLLGAAQLGALEFYHQLLKLCADMRIPIEGLHTETGPGVLEAAIQYCEALEAADRGALFKTFTKVLAQRNGMMATFMAKWSKDWPGQSGHVHTSLKRKSDGKAAFHDASKPHNMSDEMRWYVGGQQKLMPSC